MTNWIMGTRQSGRSTELIYLAAEKDLLIVTADNHKAEHLYKMAQDMGKEIRKPVSFYTWIRKPHQFFDYKETRPGILLDDADFVLSCLLRTSVIYAVLETEAGCHCSIVMGGE